MMRRQVQALALSLAFLFPICALRAAPQEITTAILVRHAEKAGGPQSADMQSDPPLSEQGRERAELLAGMLRGSGVDALYASQFQRTQLTVKPLAEVSGASLTVHDARDVAGLAQKIREEHKGQLVVVASHSNIVPALIQALGIQEGIQIPESQYDDLFVVTLIGEEAKLLRLKYGRRTE